ncbi:hypothetical protein U8335_16960 [Roseiconus lacunae]|nr:hypothetical protein U8335_16960 [Stieleria sp. HD01]
MEKKRKAEEKRNRRKDRKVAESALPRAQSDGECEEAAKRTTDSTPTDNH